VALGGIRLQRMGGAGCIDRGAHVLKLRVSAADAEVAGLTRCSDSLRLWEYGVPSWVPPLGLVEVAE